MEKDNRIKAWANLIDMRMPPIIYPVDLHDNMDLTVGGGRPGIAPKKPRKPRRRKEVTANKFIVLRVNEDLYQKVRASSELTGTDISKWVRQAVLEQLSK